MTAINLATDIPSSINTLEQLAAWSGNCLANLNSNLNAVEGENYSQRAAQSGDFYIPNVDKRRTIIRLSMEISPDSLIGSLKPWMYALPLSDKPLTSAMKSN
jgi:hypothetical protein